MSSSDPNELNQDGTEEHGAAKHVDATTDTTDSTEETLQENVEVEEDATLQSTETVTAEPVVEEPVAETPVEEPVAASTSEEAVTEEPAADTPVEEPVAEVTAEEPVAETEEKELIVLDVEAGTETESETKSEDAGSEEANPEGDETAAAAEDEDEEEEEEEEEALQLRDDFSEDAMLQQIDNILDNETNLDQLIESATPYELIFMLDHFYKAEEVQPYIRRVGLIKRAFDGVREKEEVPQSILGRFSTALARFNKKRSEYQATQDQLKEVNSHVKRDLLDKLKAIVDAEDVNKINEVREIQQGWKDVGHVKREDMEALFREYRFLLDSFYKNRELHFQLRDYDRQINLQEKDRLLAELKTIIPEESERENRDIWTAKNDQLTDIQMRWRAVGHVPRDDMDRINDSYREITGQFFSIRREFFETQDDSKKENEDKKRVLLEKMKVFEEYQSEKPKDWNSATEQLRVLQEEWKEIGPAPKEVNSELWKSYRNVGNAFFGKKAEFFRQLDEKRNGNLTKKRELCEKAEVLKDAGEFEKAAREMRMLQEEWKNTGPVPERYSNKLWGRFRAACDAFFEARRTHFSSRRGEEDANLSSKKELIEEVRKVSMADAGTADKAIGLIKDIQARWKSIGRVPFKEKDTIWKEFRAEIDQFFEDLRGNRDRTNYANLKEKVETLPEDKRSHALKGRIQKLRRKMDAISEKVEQYSTNIQFISKGKSGDSLRAQIQKEIDKETRVLKEMRKQMKQLNDLLKNPPVEEVAVPVEAEKASEAVEAVAGEATEAVEAVAEEATETVEAVVEEATEAVEAVVEEATETVETVAAETTEAVETVVEEATEVENASEESSEEKPEA